jgi:hypothetical protein
MSGGSTMCESAEIRLNDGTGASQGLSDDYRKQIASQDTVDAAAG